MNNVKNNRLEFENIIPSFLAERIFYIENDCTDIWDWSLECWSVRLP